MKLWWRLQRRMDLLILWPACRAGAQGDLAVAKAAFAVHALHAKAWRALGENEVKRIIDGLA